MTFRSEEDEIQVIVPGSKSFLHHVISYQEDSDDIIIVPNLSPRSARTGGYSDPEPDDQGFFESYESSTWERHGEDGARLKPPRSRTYGTLRSNQLTSNSETDMEGKKRLISQKQFHRKSNFVRARYPSHLTSQDKQRPSTAHKHGAKYNVPSSFRPTTRYNREPRLMDLKERKDKNRPWPKPPQYDPRPKKKNVATECEILKLVETMDIGTQNVSLTKTIGSQATKRTTNSFTQYPQPKLREKGIQAPGVRLVDTGTQNVPRMRNQFVETPIRATYYPHLMVTEDVGIQCSSSTSSEEVPVLHIHPSTPTTEHQDRYVDDFDSSDTDSDVSTEGDSDDDIAVLSYLPDNDGQARLSYLPG